MNLVSRCVAYEQQKLWFSPVFWLNHASGDYRLDYSPIAWQFNLDSKTVFNHSMTIIRVTEVVILLMRRRC